MRQRAKEEDDETRDQKARLKTLAARRRELEDIQYEFKKQGFDNPRSTFREDNLVGDMLNDFLRGGISAANYWDQWRRSQKWSAGRRGTQLAARDAADGRATWRRRFQLARQQLWRRRAARAHGGPGGGWGRIQYGGFGGGGSAAAAILASAHRLMRHPHQRRLQDRRRVLERLTGIRRA